MGVVTGMHTEFGKFAQILRTVETDETALRENLNEVGRALAKAAFVVEALALQMRQTPDRLLQTETKTIGGTR